MTMERSDFSKFSVKEKIQCSNVLLVLKDSMGKMIKLINKTYSCLYISFACSCVRFYQDFIFAAYASGHFRVFHLKKESMICEVAAHARWITGFDISHDGLVSVIIIIITITITKNNSTFYSPLCFIKILLIGSFSVRR